MSIVLQTEPLNFGQAVLDAQHAYHGQIAKLLGIDDKERVKRVLMANGIDPGVEVWVGYCSPIDEDSRVGSSFKPGDPTNTSPVVVRISDDRTVRARVNVDPAEVHPYLVDMH
ncbi:hypothetical protein [Nocardia sp. NPDC052566]|uniref:hypothetical protein n=1 Tax=Nocardia sp. NPDC052566 TaxID=3364330 RepID=UPI0037CC64EA